MKSARQTTLEKSVETSVWKPCPLVLCIIYNKSMSESHLPQDWKDANILPIFKSGERTNCGNYRPISLTSIVIKIFEKIVHKKMFDYIERNKLLDPEQFGFRKFRNCEIQLLLYANYIAKQLDLGIPVHSI